MKHTTILMGLGGLVLSLGLWSAADGHAADSDQAEPVERELVLASVEPVEVERLAEEGYVVQPAQPQGQAIVDHEMADQIIKELVQAGLSEAEAREMLGLQPTALQEQESVESSGELVDESPDGAALYLPLGVTRTLAVEAGATLEVPFVADGPGILTLAYANSGGGGLTVAVLDDRGRRVRIEASRSASVRTSDTVRHELVPLGEPGEYTVRLTIGRAGDLKLGAEWIPFPQIEMARAAILPEPDPETALTLVPGRMAEGAIDTNDADASYLWCRYDATEDGQLVVLANASRGDITMQSFMDGQFQYPIESVDSDLNGSVANEGIILDVEAGQTYYVRVDMRSGRQCDVEVRTGWIPLPEPE